MHIQDYIRIGRQNLVLLVVLLILGCSGGLAVSLVQPPMYKASIRAFVSAEQATNLADLAQGAQYAQQAVRGYAAVVDTPLVLEPVIDQLGLSRSMGALQEQVEASAPVDTPVLNITVTDRSPSDAARIANAVGQSLSNVVTTLTPPTANSVAPVKITVVEGAVPPTSPAIPNTPMNVLIGCLIGFAIALFIALLRNALEHRGEEDLQRDDDLRAVDYDYDPPRRRRSEGRSQQHSPEPFER